MFFWFVVQELCFETGNKKGRQSCKSLPHIPSAFVYDLVHFCVFKCLLIPSMLRSSTSQGTSFACALDRRDSSEPAKMEIGWVLLKTFEKSIKVHVAGWIVCKTKTKLICKESYATFHLKKDSWANFLTGGLFVASGTEKSIFTYIKDTITQLQRHGEGLKLDCIVMCVPAIESSKWYSYKIRS